jgi:hypothetical protein
VKRRRKEIMEGNQKNVFADRPACTKALGQGKILET